MNKTLLMPSSASFERHFQKMKLISVNLNSTVHSSSSLLSEYIMRTHFSGPVDRSSWLAPSTAVQPSMGGITELRYSEQSRWQLWLTPAHKVSRRWIQQSGLPLEKSMHITESDRLSTVENMVKALRTGNYSVVLAWIPCELQENERQMLQQAAEEGEALGLIMRPEEADIISARQPGSTKIPSDLFH